MAIRMTSGSLAQLQWDSFRPERRLLRRLLDSLTPVQLEIFTAIATRREDPDEVGARMNPPIGSVLVREIFEQTIMELRAKSPQFARNPSRRALRRDARKAGYPGGEY